MKWLHKLTRYLLAAALMLQLLPVSAFAASPVYLALGDSISTGYGLADPDEGFVARLAEQLPEYDLVNAAVDGNTAEGIYELLNSGELDETLASAHLITITCGGNDLMAVLYGRVADAYNTLHPDTPIQGSEITTIFRGEHPAVTTADLLLPALAAILGLADSEEFHDALSDFEDTLSSVMAYIRQTNPHADVVVATQYNPYKAFQGDDLFDVVYSEVEIGVQMLNEVIISNASLGYHVADTYTAFLDSEENLCNAHMESGSTPELDFHPNAAGHEVIADVFSKAIAEAPPLEPVICTVTLEGLEETYTFSVPAGSSLNETYCDELGVSDFSKAFDTKKSGYTFRGFYTENKKKFDFDTPITGDLTLQATWKVKKASSGGGSSYAEPEQPKPEEIAPSLSSGFSDLDPGAWYHDAVNYVLDKGLMAGVGDGRFDPDGTTSRAMIVTMLWQLEGAPVVNYLMPFEDVPAEQWYTEAVRWAAAEGIISGYSTTAFGPNDNITREQLAAILYRFEQYKGGGFTGAWFFLLNVPDRAQISDWAYEPMCWMYMNKVLVGDSAGALAPQDTASRAAAAQMLMSYLK